MLNRRILTTNGKIFLQMKNKRKIPLHIRSLHPKTYILIYNCRILFSCAFNQTVEFKIELNNLKVGYLRGRAKEYYANFISDKKPFPDSTDNGFNTFV